MKKSIKKFLIIGGAFAISVVFFATFLNHGAYYETILVLALLAVASAFLGFVMWWSFITRRQEFTYLRCVLTEIATSIVSLF